MKPFKSLILLSILTGLLAMLYSAVGLFSGGGSGPFSFTTLHGETVQMYGQGLYRYDTYFKAPIFRGTDAVTLFVCLPLVVIAILLNRSGSLRGKLFLAGVLSYFLYDSASYAFGATYNSLFLVYVAGFSASLFAIVLAIRQVDLPDLPSRVRPSLPHRGIAILLFVSAAGLLFAWLPDILGALARGGVPGGIDSYTTEITYVLDLGIIVPALVLAGILLLRRAPAGYWMAGIFLVLLPIVGVMVTAQTVAQSLAGISLAPGELIGKAGSFIILALFSVWLAVRFFRGIGEPVISIPRQGKAERT